MALKDELIRALDSFRTKNINKPIGVHFRNGGATFYQKSSTWRVNTIFNYCYVPKKLTGFLLPNEMQRLIEISHYLQSTSEEYIIVPKLMGFDILKPVTKGNPDLIHEIRFYTVHKWLPMQLLRLSKDFNLILKIIKNDIKRS